jgi:hypothetical protein
VDTSGWATLTAVLDEAVALQAAAEQAIRACGGNDQATGEAAHPPANWRARTSPCASGVRPRMATEDLSALVARVERLLHVHQWLLSEALHMRLSVAPNLRRSEFFRRFTGLHVADLALAGLGEQLGHRAAS